MTPREMQHFCAVGASGTWWHVVSRTVGRDHVFGEAERDWFAGWLRQVEKYSGVEVVTWTMLSNHFHIVVYIPSPDHAELDDASFWERVTALYGLEGTRAIHERLDEVRREKPGEAGEKEVEKLLQNYRDRMGEVSAFMKTLLQRFTSWFNREHQRRGRLWESRFKSLLIEGDWNSVSVVSAYVDLNAVRAGLVDDPKDYPWCGYAEAVAGKAHARRGLMRAFATRQAEEEKPGADGSAPRADEPNVTWREVHRAYRQLLYGTGENMSDQEIPAKGEHVLTLPQLLRRRVRYFSDGAVLGSRRFVDEMFASRRAFFGSRRETGARKMRGGQWNNLYTLRDLRKDAVEGIDLE